MERMLQSQGDEVPTGVYQAKGDVLTGFRKLDRLWPHVSRKTDGVPN